MLETSQQAKPNRTSTLQRLEAGHFWFVARRALVGRKLSRFDDLLSSPVLDVGCGTGWLGRMLAARGYSVIGLDDARDGLDRSGGGSHRHVLGNAMRMPFRDLAAGGIVLLDLLEHVDDVAVLREVSRVLRPGGLVLLSVPAGPKLWSNRDDVAGHLRRYRLQNLVQILENSGLDVLEARRYLSLLYPLFVASRLAGRRVPAMSRFEEFRIPVVNRLLLLIAQLDVRIGDHVPFPWGSSIVVVCQKPA